MKTNKPIFDKELLKNKKLLGIVAAVTVCTGTVGYATYQAFTPPKADKQLKNFLERKKKKLILGLFLKIVEKNQVLRVKKSRREEQRNHRRFKGCL